MNFQTIRWAGQSDGYCIIVEQTELPETFREVELRSVEQMFQAIQRLAVRGAPAIGVAGAYGMVLALAQCQDQSIIEDLGKFRDYLNSSRPTAVNLSWATQKVMQRAIDAHQKSHDVRQAVFAAARAIDEDDRSRCSAIGQHGEHLVPEGGVCLTHCNAGALATAGQGTALSIFYAAHDKGRKFKVYADETRPLLQGSRLTAWELNHAGIDVTVITDSMAGFLMKSEKVDLVVVGADRIAANGDTANKIGTYTLAILAKEHGVPFYVAAPLSTFDFAIKTGDAIPIEQRHAQEITNGFGKITAPNGVSVWNPAFDVTPSHLIAGFITDKGQISPNHQGEYSDVLAHYQNQ